jgi:hypothetical protein
VCIELLTGGKECVCKRFKKADGNEKMNMKMIKCGILGLVCPPYSITQWYSKGGKIMYDNFGG